MYVLTIDQARSRRSPDRVPELLAALSDVGVLAPFERTVGDEVQGVPADAAAALAAIRICFAEGGMAHRPGGRCGCSRAGWRCPQWVGAGLPGRPRGRRGGQACAYLGCRARSACPREGGSGPSTPAAHRGSCPGTVGRSARSGCARRSGNERQADRSASGSDGAGRLQASSGERFRRGGRGSASDYYAH